MEPKKKIERFEDLVVWQKAMSLAEEVYRFKKRDKVKGTGDKGQVVAYLYLVSD